MTALDDHGFARPPRGEGRLVAGVCAGLAARWDLPPIALRCAFVVATVAFGAGLLLYLALALTMPAKGATSATVARSAEVGRTLLLAVRVTGALLALAALAGIAAALALFGLGSVALILACACLLVLIVNPAARPAPLGAAAVALTLPAAAVALGNVQLARQVGAKTVELRAPAEVDPAGYRTGTGPLLLDLRRFAARPGTTTTIRARADLRSLVVALPRNRCFSLVVDQTLDPQWPARVLDQRRPAVLHLGAPVRSPTARERELAAGGQVPSLVAFGRPVLGSAVRYRRRAATPGAPVLHLVLSTGRSQAIVRDYPQTAHPLADPWWPWPRLSGDDRFGIPRGQLAAQSVPDDPLVPTFLRMLDAREPFTVANHVGVRGTVQSILGPRLPSGMTRERYDRLRRFLAQEVRLRAAAREVDAYGPRLAGPCAPRREVLQALSSVALGGSTHAYSRLGARWNVIMRRWPEARRWLHLYHGSLQPPSLPAVATGTSSGAPVMVEERPAR